MKLLKLSLMLSLLITGLVFNAVTNAYSDGGKLTAEAQQIYNDYHKAVVQIRVISRGSGEKTTLGSGFYFQNNRIATNYHVISDAVNHPELFSMEYIMPDGQKGPLVVLNFDPVHDIAVVKPDINNETFLQLGNSNLQKGDKIFSFGNPYDLGLIIIEGLYNGLVENARYRKILLSGSLNPGMSGGPAVGGDGRVLGVNVATSGNDISFIVPVEFLANLYAEYIEIDEAGKNLDWPSVIRNGILNDQEELLTDILSRGKWNKRLIGKAEVPGEISGDIRCWGETGENNNSWVEDNYLRCSISDGIFVSRTLRTGIIYFGYEWYASRGLDTTRFYNLFEQYAANRDFYFDNAQQRDVGNFKCDRFFSVVDGKNAKIEFCTRPYLQYKGLYDFTAQITSTHLTSAGLVVNLYGLGFSDSQAKRFMERFLKEIAWKE